jgi:hypothetical protein
MRENAAFNLTCGHRFFENALKRHQQTKFRQRRKKIPDKKAPPHFGGEGREPSSVTLSQTISGYGV